MTPFMSTISTATGIEALDPGLRAGTMDDGRDGKRRCRGFPGRRIHRVGPSGESIEGAGPGRRFAAAPPRIV
jgi:hypothetical protein